MSGRNMAVELDSRNPLLPKSWMGKLRLDSDFKERKRKFLQIQVLSMLGVKEINTKTNKIIIVKNRKLATQNFLFNMHINFPYGNIRRLSLLWKICLNMIL